MGFAFIQILSCWGVWVVLKIFTDYRVEGIENIKKIKKPYILAANHKSSWDPPLVSIAIVGRPLLFPVRFMTKDVFFKWPGINLLFYLEGCYKANKKKGLATSLKSSLKILNKKGAIIIFPEGHTVPDRNVLGEPRRGAAAMAISTDVEIVPIAVKTPKLTIAQFLFTRPKMTVVVGEPFSCEKCPDICDENIAKANKVIMSKISQLYFGK